MASAAKWKKRGQGGVYHVRSSGALPSEGRDREGQLPRRGGVWPGLRWPLEPIQGRSQGRWTRACRPAI